MSEAEKLAIEKRRQDATARAVELETAHENTRAAYRTIGKIAAGDDADALAAILAEAPAGRLSDERIARLLDDVARSMARRKAAQIVGRTLSHRLDEFGRELTVTRKEVQA